MMSPANTSNGGGGWINLIVLVILLVGGGYGIYKSIKNKKSYKAFVGVGLFLILLGFRSLSSSNLQNQENSLNIFQRQSILFFGIALTAYGLWLSYQKINKKEVIKKPDSDKLSQLERLISIKEKGFISEEEFNKEKQKLLNDEDSK